MEAQNEPKKVASDQQNSTTTANQPKTVTFRYNYVVQKNNDGVLKGKYRHRSDALATRNKRQKFGEYFTACIRRKLKLFLISVCTCEIKGTLILQHTKPQPLLEDEETHYARSDQRSKPKIDKLFQLWRFCINVAKWFSIKSA